MKKLIALSVILMLSLTSCYIVRRVHAADATLAPMQRQFFDNLGKVLSGGKLEFYEVGTSTPKATYANPGATVANSPTITLDSAGRANFYLDGCYKVIIKTAAGSLLDTIDKACEYTTSIPTMSQWQASGIIPVYISGTSFSCAGDQTGMFEAGLRIRSSNSGGTIYSNVVSSSYGAGITTVTVVNDSGSLDSGISSVDIGILTVTNPGIPTKPVATKTGNYTVLATDCGKILSANLSAASAFTLPAANAVPSGCEIVTKNTTTWTLTITGTVDGVSGPTLGQYGAKNIWSNGSSWYSASLVVGSDKTLFMADSTQPGGTKWINGGIFIGHQILTSGTSYTPTAGTKHIIVEMVGGGGAGGGGKTTTAAQVSPASGGGGGGYARKVFLNIGAGPFTYAIGAGGTGVSGADGNVGGNTSFTGPGPLTIIGTGGGGGVSGTASGVPARVSGGSSAGGTNGDININSEAGTDSFATTLDLIVGGEGGSSMLGHGARRALVPTVVNPTPVVGTNYGGGGGGTASILSTGTANTGGAGAQGVIIVWEFL